MNAFQLATSTCNMPVGADHLVSTLVARCSLARRLPVKVMSKYVAALDATGEVCPLASLADKTKGGWTYLIGVKKYGNNNKCSM